MWVKITQGDLIKSEIQKVQAVNDEVVTIDLSQWEPGEINIWLVVENGVIQIEQVKKSFPSTSVAKPLEQALLLPGDCG